MRIISRGNLPEQQIYAGTCLHCNTRFECLKHEGDYFSGDQRDGPFLTVKCPVCTRKAHAYPTKRYDKPEEDNSRYRWGTSDLAHQIASVEKPGWTGDR